MLRVEQRVDCVDDPGGFATPDGEMGVRQVGQQKRHCFAWTQAQAVEGVGGLGDLAQQLAVAQAVGRLVHVALQDEGQRWRVTLQRGTAADQLIGAGRQVALGERGLLDLLNVAQGLDRRDSRHRWFRSQAVNC